LFPRPTTVALLQRPLWFISGRLVEADGARTDLIHRDQDNFEPALPQGSPGRDALVRAGATKLPSVQVHALDAKCGIVAPLVILRLLYAQLGVRRLLHEGGPTLFVQFPAAEAVDELFLTLSPQIAVRKRGRNSTCAYAGDRVYAGLCSSVLTQRRAKGSASVLAPLRVRL